MFSSEWTIGRLSWLDLDLIRNFWGCLSGLAVSDATVFLIFVDSLMLGGSVVCFFNKVLKTVTTNATTTKIAPMIMWRLNIDVFFPAGIFDG